MRSRTREHEELAWLVMYVSSNKLPQIKFLFSRAK